MFIDDGPPSSRPARLGDHVYADLSLRLVTGAYAAGQALSVRELKDEFGVSKQPVLDAMRLLSADGLVEILPQAGCRVRNYSPEDARRFFRMFAAAESTIVMTATEVAADDELYDLQRATHGQADQRPAGQSAGDRSLEYWRANRRFHGHIHALAKSPLLTGVSHRMWDIADFLLSTLGGPQIFGRHEASRHAEHHAIAAAMAGRDAELAGSLMRDHVLTNSTLIDAERAGDSPATSTMI